MKRLLNPISWLWLLVVPGALANTADVYPFESAEKTAIFQEVTAQLRCLVCQNQSIADSTAPLAGDLRQVVYEQIQQGADKAAVMAYVTQRYGNYVRYKPPLNTSTALLWWGPFLLLGVIIALILINKGRQERKHLEK